MPARHITLAAHHVSVTRGDRRILTDVDLVVSAGARLAISGPNGVGKSTLLRVLAGELEPDAGSVTRSPRDLTVGLVRQELRRRPDVTAREHIAEVVGVAAAQRAFDAATIDLADGRAGAADRYDQALAHWIRTGAADFTTRVDEASRAVDLSPHILDLPTSAISGGQAARVGLLAVMVAGHEVLLLDEPTNDLDDIGLALLERWVADHDGAVVVVSHDRAFLERTVTAVAEIDEHDHTVHRYDGSWTAYLDERARRAGLARRAYDDDVGERDRLRARAQRQREWADQGARRVRHSPADGDKFRRRFQLDQTEQLAGRAAATTRALERLEIVEKPWEGWDLRFTIGAAPRSGQRVVGCDGLIVGRGDFRLGPLDLEIDWGERVRLAGPNGSGKSTLIDVVLGRLEPNAGTVRLGPSVVVGELTQQRTGPVGDPEATVLEGVQAATQLALSEARSVLAKFGLDADAVDRPAHTLSPGERTRADLALFQARRVNLVVLDEPTNHLDLPAIEQLESALSTYDGTLLVVSHDRRFVEALDLDRTIDLAPTIGAEGGRRTRAPVDTR